MKGFPSKHTVSEVDLRVEKTGKCAVCRHVCALFSPEIVQVGAVKGLRGTE